MREIFSRAPDEPLPDLSSLPSELFEFTSVPGAYFDAFPVHLHTTSSLAAMSRLDPAAAWDVRRFRPNFLIETTENTLGFIKATWRGRTLRLGEVRLTCETPTARCGMTTHAQADLARDRTVLRTIIQNAGQNLGIYASVIGAGEVDVDDQVELL